MTKNKLYVPAIWSVFMIVLLFSSTAWADLKGYPSGLILRGKLHSESYCDKPKPGTDGAYCQIRWEDLQPGPNRFNFSLIDQAIRDAKTFNTQQGRKGKARFKILLRIRTGIYSPAWLLNRTGSVNWHFRDTSKSHKLPLFWENNYQDEYKKMMAVLAERYDSQVLIGGVATSMCMTYHAETMWNRTGRKEVRSVNMANMRAARNADDAHRPYTNAKDWSCLKNQIRAHKVWKQTPTLLAAHLYQVYNYQTGEASPQTTPTIELFNYCRNTLGNRCILGNNSLNWYESTHGTVYGLIVQAGGPTYFQTNVFQNSPGTRTVDFKDLLKTIDKSAEWGAHMVELPMGWDCKDIYQKTGCTSAIAQKRADNMRSGRAALKTNWKRWK